MNNVGDISDRPVVTPGREARWAHLPHEQTEVFMEGDTGPCTSTVIRLQNILVVKTMTVRIQTQRFSTSHYDLFNKSPLHATVAYSINKGWC